ncbi:ATP/GTP-binding protein [Streptomyces sp. NPDC020096]
MAAVRSDQGEQADVVVDLVAVPQRAVARRRRRLMARAKQRGPSAFGERIGGTGGGGGGLWSTLVDGLNGGRTSGQRVGRIPRQTDLADGVGKFTPGTEVFALQLLVRATGTHPARARAHLNRLLAALEAFSGQNRLVPVGPRRTGWRPYSNVWWRRRSFDRRLASGEFAPVCRQWVTTAEIAALLKPPTAHCTAVNVARGGGTVPAAPAGLPEWTGQPDVVPLGLVTGPDGRSRLGGVYEADLLFAAYLGKSGFGKTEEALLQAISRAYAGRGTWFLDPHGEALARARPYLAHPAVMSRMWQIDLSTPSMSDRVASWNPLSMEGKRIEQIQDVIGAVVGGIASAQGWVDGAPRARTILSNAVWVLAELSHRLIKDGHPELQPTLFQIKTLLTDEAWREEVVSRLPKRIGKFWRTTFLNLAGEAVPVVTNTLDRLDASLSLRAFFGSPRSSYNVRQAMDTSRVVWICPSGTGESDDLVCSLLLFDLFRAGLSRRDTPVEQRRSFWAYVDELTAVDNAARGYIAKVLEQLRKYEVRLMAMTQMAMRLKEGTRQALLQNQSVLSVTGADTDEARYVAARLPHVTPETVEGLRKYTHVMSVMLRGERTTPFRVQGVPIHEVLADYYNPDGLAELDAAIDANLDRRTVEEITGELENLDEEILQRITAWPVINPKPASGRGTKAAASGDVESVVGDHTTEGEDN